MGYKVKLNSFEGPFDLLVYLIENAEMDIYDIQIAEITAQYMDYVKKLKEVNIAMFSEFMVLAAELIAIKSKMLIPREDPETGFIMEEDPRTDLVERILEYKRFKNASEALAVQEERGRNIFEKPQEDISQYLDAPDEYLALDIKQFVKAFEIFISKKQRLEEVKKRYTRVRHQKESLEAKFKQIKSSFKRLGKKTVLFKELLTNNKDKYDIALTFSSLLELAKERCVGLDQEYTYGDIKVTEKKENTKGDKQESN